MYVCTQYVCTLGPGYISYTYLDPWAASMRAMLSSYMLTLLWPWLPAAARHVLEPHGLWAWGLTTHRGHNNYKHDLIPRKSWHTAEFASGNNNIPKYTVKFAWNSGSIEHPTAPKINMFPTNRFALLRVRFNDIQTVR